MEIRRQLVALQFAVYKLRTLRNRRYHFHRVGMKYIEPMKINPRSDKTLKSYKISFPAVRSYTRWLNAKFLRKDLCYDAVYWQARCCMKWVTSVEWYKQSRTPLTMKHCTILYFFFHCNPSKLLIDVLIRQLPYFSKIQEKLFNKSSDKSQIKFYLHPLPIV